MRSLGIRVWLEANQHAVKDVQITAQQLVQMFAEMFANLVFFISPFQSILGSTRFSVPRMSTEHIRRDACVAAAFWPQSWSLVPRLLADRQ